MMWYVVQKSPQSLLQIMKPSQQSAAVSSCQQNAPDSDLLQPPIQTSWMLPEHLPRTGLLQTPQVRLGGKLDRYRSKMKVKWLIYPPRGYLLEYNGLEQPNKECIAKLMPPGKKKTPYHPSLGKSRCLNRALLGETLEDMGLSRLPQKSIGRTSILRVSRYPHLQIRPYVRPTRTF